jgi:hypothetical protein
MSHDDIARRRLAAQHLVEPALETPAEVVQALGAVQAQEFWLAKWSIAKRTTGFDDTARSARCALYRSQSSCCAQVANSD